MQVLTHLRCLGHGCKRVGSHVFRVRTGEPHSTNTIDGTNISEQLRKQRAEPGIGLAGLACGQLQIAPVAVDVLAEQRHFGDTVRCQLLGFSDDVGIRSRNFGPRTAGTIQKAQLLSHPIWMVSQAL